MVNVRILCMTHDPLQEWVCAGIDREDAEKRYRYGIASKAYQKPAYRVVATRKKPFEVRH